MGSAYSPLLGLSGRETRRFSILRALDAAQRQNWGEAGFEAECSREIAKRLNKAPRPASFFVPLEVQARDMSAAGVSGSNYLVGTDNQPASFVELVRARSITQTMGATRLPGLVGNVSIPRQTAPATGHWLVDENSQITESQATIGQIVLSPKNVAALTELSHQLRVQSSPAAEAIVTADLAAAVALALDAAVINGSGSNGEPHGIIGTDGVGSVSGTSLAAAGVLEFQSDVAAANLLGQPGNGYVTTSAVAALLAARVRFESTASPLRDGALGDGVMLGHRAMSTAQMPAATMVFGHWPSVLIGEWGVLELMINPFSDFTRGLSAVRAWYTADVAIRYPGAFSVAESIT